MVDHSEMSRDESKKHKLCLYLQWIIIERLKLSELWEIKLSRKTLNFIDHQQSQYTKQNGKIPRSLNTRQWLAQGTVGWPCCYNTSRSVTTEFIDTRHKTVPIDYNVVFKWFEFAHDIKSYRSSTTRDLQLTEANSIYISIQVLGNIYFIQSRSCMASRPQQIWQSSISLGITKCRLNPTRDALSRGPTLQFSPSIDTRR